MGKWIDINFMSRFPPGCLVELLLSSVITKYKERQEKKKFTEQTTDPWVIGISPLCAVRCFFRGVLRAVVRWSGWLQSLQISKSHMCSSSEARAHAWFCVLLLLGLWWEVPSALSSEQIQDASPLLFLPLATTLECYVAHGCGGWRVVTWLSYRRPVGFLTFPFHLQQWITRCRRVHKWRLVRRCV